MQRNTIFRLTIVCVIVIGAVVGFALLYSDSGTPDNTQNTRPSFSADSAYQFIAEQVSMGPRVPDTREHTICLLYLMQQMERFGGMVECQHGTMVNYCGKEQQVINIITHFGTPTAHNRILLGAHYDCRPWSDEEDDYNLRFTPIPGANDGASGVGVLMEIARQLGLAQKDSTRRVRPVDIIFFDCEDMGTPSFYTDMEREDTWCLGSQLWASTLDKNNPYQFGVILDMVGDPQATFPKEYFSMEKASNYVEKLWNNANRLGYGRYFVQQEVYPITDDHYYINKLANIPCLDIINYAPTNGKGFPVWWHTQEDDMQHIDRHTLQAVGETVMSIVM